MNILFSELVKFDDIDVIIGHITFSEIFLKAI